MLLSLCLIGCTNPPKKVRSVNISHNYPGEIYGIDVSHHQGEINWLKVKSWNEKPLSFVYIKATEGSSYVDRNYQQNTRKARGAGIKVGSYHFFRTTSSADSQFEHFIATIGTQEQDLIPMVDLEENDRLSREAYNTEVKKFLLLLENHFGQKPLIYAPQGFYNTYLKENYLKYYWSIARYSSQKPNLHDANNWTLWQFTEHGSVDGIDVPVDINVLNADHKLEFLELR